METVCSEEKMTAPTQETSPFFIYAAKSDLGRKRQNNEDSYGVFAEAGAFFVADGMGGGDDGEIASASVIQELEKCCGLLSRPDGFGYAAEDVADAMSLAIDKSSNWIFQRSEAKHLKGCGSTIVGFFLDWTKPGTALALHAGDSRLYRIRGRSIRQITKDHSAAELFGTRDEKKINPVFRGMITRAVGIAPSVDVERTPFDIRCGDKMLVCSDGLTKMVPEKRILEIIRGEGRPEAAVSQLVDAAHEAGGVDNVTVVLVAIGNLPNPAGRIPSSAIIAKLKEDEDTRRTDDGTGESTDTGETPTQSGADSDTCATLAPLNSVSDSIKTETKIAICRPGPSRPLGNGNRYIRKTLVIAGLVAVAAVAVAASLWMWRQHVRSRERKEAAARLDAARQQELVVRHERERAEQAQRRAEAERETEKRRRRMADEEKRLAEEAERAQKKAMRDRIDAQDAKEVINLREKREERDRARKAAHQ